MIYINILMIGLIMVFALDVSGFWNEITSIISGWLTNGQIKKPITLKPFSCSLCMTFWLSLIYVIIMNSFSLPMVGYICLIAFLTPIFNDIMVFVRETLKTIIIKLNKINE